jgi:hypothetical protein
MSNDPKYSGVRLSGFAAASLWHRRLVRTNALNYVKVRPRLAAELVLQSVRRDGVSAYSTPPGRADAGRHAA